MKHQSILFYSRCLLAILAVTGTALEIIKYGIGMLMYYTVQSNLLVSLFAVYCSRETIYKVLSSFE